MSRAAQIQWWMEQVEVARHAVSTAQDERRRPRRSGLLDGDRTSKAGQVAALPNQMPAQTIIRGSTISGKQDEERQRSLSAGSSGGAGAGLGSRESRGRAGGAALGGSGVGSGGALGRARQLAAGYQPAVVKVVSYARGVARSTAAGQYVQREDVALETHDGRMLADREAVADEIRAWSSSFSKRAESQDVVAMRLTLHGVRDTPEGRDTYEKAIAAGFGGHRFVFRIDATPSGELEARLVVVMAGAAKERFRVHEERIGDAENGFNQRRLDSTSEAVVKARIAAATAYPTYAMSIDPGASNHGRDGVTYRLNKLIEKGAAIDDRGMTIANVADTRIAARDWGPLLRSQSSRDVMHLIISAKAGTDVAALTNAARAFLYDRFADHKFMFGIHTDKEAEGHIHAHAIITVKNESGQKIHPGRDTFRDWREAYAEHAQAQGLKIVATSAKERASSQSYGPRDKAIVDVADRPRPAREARDRAYAADPANQRLIENARQRIQAARTNPIRLSTTGPARWAVNESVVAWRVVAETQPQNPIAKQMLERMLMAQTLSAILHSIEKRVDHLTKEDQSMATTSQQMAKDLQLMNEAVSRTSDLLDGETRQQFQQTSARYLETLGQRVDLQRTQEGGAEQLSRTEVEALVGSNADRLIERAQEIRQTEVRDAAAAERLADRAIEVERRREGRAGIDPESQRELLAERVVVAGTQQSAAREEREAAAAVEAARSLAEHPGQPLQSNLIQTDALAKLRQEQERVVREIEAEKSDAQSIKGQRME